MQVKIVPPIVLFFTFFIFCSRSYDQKYQLEVKFSFSYIIKSLLLPVFLTIFFTVDVKSQIDDSVDFFTLSPSPTSFS